MQGGEAVFQLLQSTGQALSPVMDKLAGMMEDDPTQAAAFRCVSGGISTCDSDLASF
jgi:hypothetical protein